MDLRLETRRGKYNWALREPKRAPLSAKIASQCSLRLTLPCAQVAWAVLRNAHPRLTLKRNYSGPKMGMEIARVDIPMSNYLLHLVVKGVKPYEPKFDISMAFD